MPFRDRTEAGRRLAAALVRFRKDRPTILALPRGGVPVAAEIATALAAPLDLLLVRKIGVPQQPELAAGAVVDSDPPIVVRNEDVIVGADVSENDFDRITQLEIEEIGRRRALYLDQRPRAPIEGRTVIVVDDGIATGATMRAALRALRQQQPLRVIVATPVAAADTIARLRTEADEIECLEVPSSLGAIGAYYEDFRQVPDAEVIDRLRTFDAEALHAQRTRRGHPRKRSG